MWRTGNSERATENGGAVSVWTSDVNAATHNIRANNEVPPSKTPVVLMDEYHSQEVVSLSKWQEVSDCTL